MVFSFDRSIHISRYFFSGEKRIARTRPWDESGWSTLAISAKS